jgi:hypothetical protein
MCFCQPTSWKVVKLSISYPVIHVNDDKITCLKTKFKLSSKNIEKYLKKHCKFLVHPNGSERFRRISFWYIRTVQNGSGVSELSRTIPNYSELIRTQASDTSERFRTVQAYQVFALDSKLKSGQFLQHNKLKMHDL